MGWVRTGNTGTVLVVVRGNSVSGKSLVEAGLRAGEYRAADLLPCGGETVIGADGALTESVEQILGDAGLLGLPACER